MKLVTFMAKSCSYAQEHIDDKDAWSTDPSMREDYLQCVSFQMACFLSQNTRDGGEGVDWDVVIGPLTEHPMKSEKKWEQILNRIAKQLGGWKSEPSAPGRKQEDKQ